MTEIEENPDRHAELVALWWRTIFPIAAFVIGALLIIYDGLIDPPSDATTSGVGLIAMGIGPFGLLDLFGSRSK